MKIALTLTLVAAAALATATAGTARSDATVVSSFKHQAFGRVLSRPDGQALYYWTRERDFKVHCTGSCAKAWPPLIVRRGVAVPRRIAGLRGTFGVVRRPDGRRQLTHNRRPVYTYAHERRRQVLCNDVDGWFVVRV
jgi:predicted lipoprotein with Yx(FWY)xxD motif